MITMMAFCIAPNEEDAFRPCRFGFWGRFSFYPSLYHFYCTCHWWIITTTTAVADTTTITTTTTRRLLVT